MVRICCSLVAKGGETVEDNLQTLCWKCNRAKGDKVVA